MPPKSSTGGGKQTTLLGFFGKSAGQTSVFGTPRTQDSQNKDRLRPKPQGTKSGTVASSSPSHGVLQENGTETSKSGHISPSHLTSSSRPQRSEMGRDNSPIDLSSPVKGNPSAARLASSPLNAISKSRTSNVKHSHQQNVPAEEEDSDLSEIEPETEVEGTGPSPSKSESEATTLVGVDGHQKRKVPTSRGSPALKKQRKTVESDDEEDGNADADENLAKTDSRMNVDEMSDVRSDDAHQSDGMRMSSRRSSKRKVVYAESDSEVDHDEDEGSSASKKARASTSASGPQKKKKLFMDDSDDDSADDYKPDQNDDDLFDDGGMDDIALLEGLSEYEANSPTKSDSSMDLDSDGLLSPVKKKNNSAKSGAFKQNARGGSGFKLPTKTTNGGGSSPTLSRPPPKPLGNNLMGSSSIGNSDGGGSSGNMFMTQAERSRLEQREAKKQEENCFKFLIDIKDKDGHRPDHPEYDNRTVYIPSTSWREFTPFEKQFWEIKQNHFDTILFFQKGKFYELYEKDAEIGHNEFDLKLTDRVKMKMVGVPEMSFDFWAAKFLAAGYKVGKVEQAETAIGKEMRNKAAVGGKGEDKIVRRELAKVLTNGTVVDEAFLSGDDASHCVAIKEQHLDNHRSSFGLCILDAATGQFELTAFDDDVVCTKLETLMRQLRPKEIIHAKNNLSVATLRVLRRILPMNTNWVPLKEGKEFYDEETARVKLNECFKSEDDLGLPPAIMDMTDSPLAIEALGGMIFYLESLNVADDLLSQRSFNVYDPIRRGETLVLDGQTLSHLEILINNEGGEDGSLLQLLQRCVTPFGKRLFRIWLTVPLQNAAAINARLDAVDDLMEHPSFSESFRRVTKGLPDLERLVSRIHANACKQSDFIKVLDAFSKMASGFNDMTEKAASFSSSSVSTLINQAPDLAPILQEVKSMFFLDEGRIIPAEGASEVCDEATRAVQAIEGQLDSLLARYKKQIGCKEMTFWHSNLGSKEVYHIQVPIKVKVPDTWTKLGGTKSLARYTTRETQPLIREVQEARETKKVAFGEFYGEMMRAFDQQREMWLKAVRIFAELDCLLSLAKASADMDEPRCRPELVESKDAFIDFRDLRHPALCLRSDFISNDVQLGGEQPRQTLLTGPNTAGKSTLCRMTAVAVIMAQLGCYVPASSARLAPIDKIQTRMGAYDNMFTSSSTFKVELDECSKILKEAGPKSLIILDELGRGTSTYDGMAIAESVLHHFATHTLPLGFFATHYGLLTDDLAYHPNVRNMHMQTHVDEEKREVFCLYKLIPGRAESSYGTHVAHLAGVPASIVTRADRVSKEFFDDFKQKLAARRKSDMPILAQADFSWLVNLAKQDPTAENDSQASIVNQLDIIRRSIPLYGH